MSWGRKFTIDGIAETEELFGTRLIEFPKLDQVLVLQLLMPDS